MFGRAAFDRYVLVLHTMIGSAGFGRCVLVLHPVVSGAGFGRCASRLGSQHGSRMTVAGAGRFFNQWGGPNIYDLVQQLSTE